MKKRNIIFLFILFYTAAGAQADSSLFFTNSLLPSGADPFSFYKDGWYYYTHTTGNNVSLWKTRNLADLKSAEKKVIYTPQQGAVHSKDIWAPEVHFLTGHNSFFTSPDGTENWILYHANSKPGQGCGRFRSPRAQKFTWAKDGKPVFGGPVKEAMALPIPSQKSID